jgi:hypothetical protein
MDENFVFDPVEEDSENEFGNSNESNHQMETPLPNKITYGDYLRIDDYNNLEEINQSNRSSQFNLFGIFNFFN